MRDKFGCFGNLIYHGLKIFTAAAPTVIIIDHFVDSWILFFVSMIIMCFIEEILWFIGPVLLLVSYFFAFHDMQTVYAVIYVIITLISFISVLIVGK